MQICLPFFSGNKYSHDGRCMVDYAITFHPSSIDFPTTLENMRRAAANKHRTFSGYQIRGMSPRVNYTDRATVACRPSWYQICGQRVSRGQRDGSLRAYSRFSRPEPLLFLSSSSSVVLTRQSGPRSRPTTQKIW
jgi:hypothetical protein